MTNKLIILMLDGISADYFQTERGRMPFISEMADKGCYVRNLHAETIGVSLSGRTSMMTGQTGDVHSITGNIYWDGERFRIPTPYDVRVPTVPEQAREAGRDVAVLGFGMLRPESAQIFRPPWWVSATNVTRARMHEPTTALWQKIIAHKDDNDRFEQAMAAAGLPAAMPAMNMNSPADLANFGLTADNLQFDWVGALATSAVSPDLIITENILPDSIQHRTGYKSDQSHWAMAYADMLVGKVVQRLRMAGKLDEYNIAVMADHGHAANTMGIYLHNLLPGVTYSTMDGAVLHVAAKDDVELAMVTEKLAPFGVEPWNKAHIPPEYRDQLSVFVAPDGVVFYGEHSDPDFKDVTGAPTNLSGHGRRPGSPLDDRLCVFFGPDVPQMTIEQADAVQIAPTFAALMDLPLDPYPGAPVFQPSAMTV